MLIITIVQIATHKLTPCTRNKEVNWYNKQSGLHVVIICVHVSIRCHQALGVDFNDIFGECNVPVEKCRHQTCLFTDSKKNEKNSGLMEVVHIVMNLPHTGLNDTCQARSGVNLWTFRKKIGFFPLHFNVPDICMHVLYKLLALAFFSPVLIFSQWTLKTWTGRGTMVARLAGDCGLAEWADRWSVGGRCGLRLRFATGQALFTENLYYTLRLHRLIRTALDTKGARVQTNCSNLWLQLTAEYFRKHGIHQC